MGLMSEPRRRPEEQLVDEPRAKPLARPASQAWRLKLALWSAEERFAWAERAAIMIEQGGVPEAEAEHAAFEDVAKYRR
jgi:hypothetical protein